MSVAPFFTVGVPTHNRARFLPGALRAILSQTFTDFELLLADNHSTDATPDVVAAIQDPRIKYFRHESNIGAVPNFNFLAREARGEFFVICQDDDLLHRDFLKRCHENVASRADVVMYATPWWRGNGQDGYESQLLRDRESRTEEYLINDQPLVLDGKEVAATMLHSFPIAHPAIAVRTRVFQELGGFYTADKNFFDVITEVRLLCRGKLVYDPRIGAMFRVHETNFSRVATRSELRGSYRHMYEMNIAELESHHTDWRRLVAEDLAGKTGRELLQLFHKWALRSAPTAMLEIAWKLLWKKNTEPTVRLWRRLIFSVGIGKLARFGAERRRLAREVAATPCSRQREANA